MRYGLILKLAKKKVLVSKKNLEGQSEVHVDRVKKFYKKAKKSIKMAIAAGTRAGRMQGRKTARKVTYMRKLKRAAYGGGFKRRRTYYRRKRY